MAENQAHHRRLRELIWQLGGFVLIAGSLGAGVWLIANDKAVGTVSLHTLSAGGLVAMALIALGFWAFRNR